MQVNHDLPGEFEIVHNILLLPSPVVCMHLLLQVFGKIKHILHFIQCFSDICRYTYIYTVYKKVGVLPIRIV